ncbi:hypothetical protein NC653_019322 [Populus alba x Populus x berolinensis]|uniref:Uncharacterized protein n=1 Tax=Populus alba x Populus x berolinensis TaxID=444605 RepID=A0AAD6VX52_9ROSI|nr:hypothetical protein NC653_019322 [Populus alba x Populus x berolinensis]
MREAKVMACPPLLPLLNTRCHGGRPRTRSYSGYSNSYQRHQARKSEGF